VLGDDHPPVPRILSAVLSVVRDVAAPLSTDPIGAHLADPRAGRISINQIAETVLERLAGQDVSPTRIMNAVMALTAAGFLRAVREGPAVFCAGSCHYLPGPVAAVMEISDEHELTFAAAQRTPAPTP